MTKKLSKYSCLSSTTFGPDSTTANFDNFTNVTAGAFDSSETSSSEMEMITDDEEVNPKNQVEEVEKYASQEETNKEEKLKLRHFNAQVAKLTDDIASRTLPPAPQAPIGLSLTTTNFNTTSSILEPESFTQKYSCLKTSSDNADNGNANFQQNKGVFKMPMCHFADANNTTCIPDSDVSFVIYFEKYFSW